MEDNDKNDKKESITDQAAAESSPANKRKVKSVSEDSGHNKENEVYMTSKSTLNYREFLTKIVKFKKVIPLTYDKPKTEAG